MHIFYTPDLMFSDETYQLSEEESKHCARVLRLKNGDKVNLVDGIGGFYEAEIIEDHPKRTKLSIVQRKAEFGKVAHHLHIAVAPTKNIDRIEWFLEKATEIGIQEITPLICDHSERKDVKIERLEKIMVSAMKQSLKAYLPTLNPPKSFKDFMLEQSASEWKYIAHCIPTQRKAISQGFTKQQRYLILIGPEGDFSHKEVQIALENGFVPITLGESRLRTETAALQACFEINYLNR